MTAHFAIPATTFVLKAIVEARLRAAYGTATHPVVSVAPPPRPAAPPPVGVPPPEPAGLTLYMHHAAANPAWRNMYDPHVDSQGARVAKAPLVLDLYYLLSASGNDLEREALLGIGMSALHRNGIIPRAMITAILGAITIPPNPNMMDLLTNEPLADPASQPESITIAQAPFDIDMSTKLWSALHAPIRPSAYYLVTTVFLDTGEVFAPPLPVKQVAVAALPTADATATPSPDEKLVTP